jgi:hypothetical protein
MAPSSRSGSIETPTDRASKLGRRKRWSASDMPARLIAAAIAILAFTAAVIGGAIVDNPPTVIITRAIVALVACYIAGSLIGAVAQRAVREHIDDYKRAHPLEEPATVASQPADSSTPAATLNPKTGDAPAPPRSPQAAAPRAAA